MPSRGVAAGRHASGNRGDLNANNDAISGTPVREEDWGLDMTGNWSDYTEKTSGSTDLDQDRTCNKVNEITDITETTGTAWVTPAQDKNGNMTTVPKSSSLANGLTLKYDAWNRLVEVKDGATVVGKYEYDGLNRRVKRHLDSDSPADPSRTCIMFGSWFYPFSIARIAHMLRDTGFEGPYRLNPRPLHECNVFPRSTHDWRHHH